MIDRIDETALLTGRQPILHTLTRRRGLPLTVLRPDVRLVALNGSRLRTPGRVRAAPRGFVCAVAFHVESRPTLREVVAHLLDPQARVLPRGRVLRGLGVEAAEALAAEETRVATAAATAAAARHLGLPVEVSGRGVRVDAVLGAGGRVPLQPGDRIVAVGDVPTRTVEELLRALAGQDAAQVTVEPGLPRGRDAPEGPGGPTSRVGTLVRRRDGRWGLMVSTDGLRIDAHLDAQIELPPDLSGGSLGLALALSLVDACTDGALGRAGHVVATGTITPDGTVGEVGGIELKARAVAAHPEVATFLVPRLAAEQLAAVRRRAGAATVVAVADLEEAVTALRSR